MMQAGSRAGGDDQEKGEREWSAIQPGRHLRADNHALDARLDVPEGAQGSERVECCSCLCCCGCADDAEQAPREESARPRTRSASSCYARRARPESHRVPQHYHRMACKARRPLLKALFVLATCLHAHKLLIELCENAAQILVGLRVALATLLHVQLPYTLW
eukprot:6181542-Pleurochrysis_carterae.AAC.1